MDFETTAGTAVQDIHTKTTSVRLREMSFSKDVAKDDENSKYLSGDFSGNDESIIGTKEATATYSLKVAPGVYYETTVGSGTYEHMLTYEDYLLNSCLGKTEVGTATTDNTAGLYIFYPSVANAEKTITGALLLSDPNAGKTHVQELAGGISNFTLKVDGVGAPFTLDFETKGKLENVYDVDTTAIGGFNDTGVMRTVADKLLETTVSITDLETDTETTSFCINSMTFSSNNELSKVECQKSESGINNFVVTGMNPSLEIDPLLQTLTDFDYWTGLTEEKFYQVSIKSNFVELLIPRAQILTSAVADSNGFQRNTLTFRALRNIDEVVPANSGITGDAEMMYFLTIREDKENY